MQSTLRKRKKQQKKQTKPNQTTTTTTASITLGRGQNYFSSASQNNAVIHSTCSRKVRHCILFYRSPSPPHPTQPHSTFFSDQTFSLFFFAYIGCQKATF